MASNKRRDIVPYETIPPNSKPNIEHANHKSLNPKIKMNWFTRIPTLQTDHANTQKQNKTDFDINNSIRNKAAKARIAHTLISQNEIHSSGGSRFASNIIEQSDRWIKFDMI